MASYLAEIGLTPLLSPEEEKELARRIGAGDPEARDRMVRANLRLVVRIARAYAGRGLPLEDLIAEGGLGLVRAAEDFDPAFGARFSTYAVYWVKQSIRKALANGSRTVRLPAYAGDLLRKWQRASAALHEELGRPPTQGEVARRLGLGKKGLNILKKAIRVGNPAARPDHAERGPSLDETVADARARTPDAEMAEADALRRALALLGEMDGRRAAVLRMRFGLDGEEPKTLKEIGELLGLTRERVRQIQAEALAELRQAVEADP